MYTTLKAFHITLAILSISGFVLRGIWMLGQKPVLDSAIVRIVPHIIDTAFLATAVWLVVELRLAVSQHAWLITKFIALILYVVLGAIALRRGRTLRIRTTAFFAAVTTYLYIVGVALHKTPLSWLA